MSANRLIANQRIAAALHSLFNNCPEIRPVIVAFVADAVDNVDEETDTISVDTKDRTVVRFNRHWIACQEDSQIRYALYHIAIGLKNMDELGERNEHVWKVASSYICNREIKKMIDAGDFERTYLVAPEHTLLDDEFADLDIGAVYEILYRERAEA